MDARAGAGVRTCTGAGAGTGATGAPRTAGVGVGAMTGAPKTGRDTAAAGGAGDPRTGTGTILDSACSGLGAGAVLHTLGGTGSIVVVEIVATTGNLVGTRDGNAKAFGATRAVVAGRVGKLAENMDGKEGAASFGCEISSLVGGCCFWFDTGAGVVDVVSK